MGRGQDEGITTYKRHGTPKIMIGDTNSLLPSAFQDILEMVTFIFYWEWFELIFGYACPVLQKVTQFQKVSFCRSQKSIESVGKNETERFKFGFLPGNWTGVIYVKMMTQHSGPEESNWFFFLQLQIVQSQFPFTHYGTQFNNNILRLI